MFDSCIVGDYDGWGGSFLEERAVVARKQYRCCECNITIGVGQKHWRAKGTSDGGWWSTRTCDSCFHVRKSLVRGSFCYGELWSMVGDQYCQTKEDRLAMLPDAYLAWLGEIHND